MLDEAGLSGVEIFASGGLDEYKIAALRRADAPISGFGVGTAMGVSADAPSLEIAYKLTAYAGEGRMKLSTGKASFPGLKQIFRREGRDGQASGDTLGLHSESLDGRPLSECVMRDGKRVKAATDLNAVRAYAAEQIAALPDDIREIEPTGAPYPVEISAALAAYTEEVRTRLERLERRSPRSTQP